MSQLVRYHVEGAVGRLVIDSPHNLNAFGSPLLVQALEAFERALADDPVRVVVISAVGRVFSSGSDLKEESPSEEPLISLLEAVRRSSKPVIASVAADVYGGALALVAVCDLVIAAEGARFAMPEARWGIAPTIASVHCVPRLRPVDALDMLLTGEAFSAQRAREAGLVTRVVDGDGLDAAVDGVARSIVLGGPVALQLCKELCQRIPLVSLDEGYRLAADISKRMLASPEGQEGMRAFAEKRSPYWVDE